MENELCKLHDKNIRMKLRGVEQHVKALITLHDLSSTYQKEQLAKILTQALLTNDRIKSLEEETVFWRWFTKKPYRLVITILTGLFIFSVVAVILEQYLEVGLITKWLRVFV